MSHLRVPSGTIIGHGQNEKIEFDPVPTTESSDQREPLKKMRQALERHRSDVPEPICKFLENALGSARSREFDFAFRLISHLLSKHHDVRCRLLGHPVSLEARAILVDARKVSIKVARRMTKRLIEVGAIEGVSPSGWGLRNVPSTFRIGEAPLATWAGPCRFYSSPSAYRNRRPSSGRPNRELHASLAAESAELRAAVLRLQEQPMCCDSEALMEHLKRLPEERRKRWLPIVMRLSDGLNFPRYKLGETGRLFTRSHGNLMGVPKELRCFFYPNAEHAVYIDFDYSSQEPRILAHLSGDSALRDAIEGGGVYDELAATFGLDRNAQAKPLFNGWLNGARVHRLARIVFGLGDLEKPTPGQLERAKAIKAHIEDRYRVASRWLKREAKRIKDAGLAVTLGGRERAIAPKDARRAGINHIIQGSAAEALHLILIRLDARLAGMGAIALPMHDGIVVEAIRGFEIDVIRVVEEVMVHASRDALDGLEVPVTHLIGWRNKATPASEANQPPRQTTDRGAAPAAPPDPHQSPLYFTWPTTPVNSAQQAQLGCAPLQTNCQGGLEAAGVEQEAV